MSAMIDDAKNRDERLDIHVDADSKSLYVRAAEVSGKDLNAFIVEAIYKHAVQTIAEHERIVLNDQARAVLLNALATPPCAK